MMSVMRVALAVPIVMFASIARAGPIEDLLPGEWYEVPDSNIRPHMPDPLPPSDGGPDALISSWNSGAYDTLRARLIVWGGGHRDYGGNEIYGFDIASLTWQRIWGPSPNIPDTSSAPCVDTYDDGNPASRHTYDGIEFIPTVNRFFTAAGSVYCSAGGGTNTTWMFDFTALAWEPKTDVPDGGYYVTAHDYSSAFDPVTGMMFVQTTRPFLEYDPTNDLWTQRGVEDGGVWGDTTAAVDPIRRLYVAVGSGMVMVWDLTTWTLTYATTTNGTAVIDEPAPGFSYDPVLETFVAWAGGADIYTLNMDTLAWSARPPAATNTVTPGGPADTGSFGRFRYMPSVNAYIVVSSVFQNVFVYRLTPLVPDDVPPAAPTGLTVPRCGVRHYWLADPERGGLELYRLAGSEYQHLATFESPVVVEPEDFPGLRIPLVFRR